MWQEVFEPPPQQWGLRGDPHLWDALRERLSQGPTPNSPADARSQLQEAFQDLVGVPPNPYLGRDHVHVEAFAHGGMSSGNVHLQTWHDRLMPLLAGRAAALLAARAGAEQIDGTAEAPGPADHLLGSEQDVHALLAQFDFGDAVVRRVELDLPAAGNASAHVRLEVQERNDSDRDWTNIVFVVRELRAFRLTQGRTGYQVLTGPPVIAQAPDGTWILDLARDRDLEDGEPTARWYDSPHFVQGQELSWHKPPQ